MTKPRAAVVGSGFGGLALAIRLQSAGFDTTIFEARDKPGGRAYVYEDKGFVFDAGPTVVTDPPCLEQLFELSGRKLEDYVELMPVAPFYRLLWEDGFEFDYDPAILLEQIAEKSPGDVEGYKKFLEYCDEVHDEGYVKLGTVPFLNFSSMIKAAPQLVRLQAYRSVYSMVSSYIKEDHLRQAFSFNSLLIGGNPFRASSIYALIHSLERRGGVWFPKGGTHALIRALVKLFEDLGGTIRLSEPVQQIVTRGGRAVGISTEKQANEDFDAIASNADVMHTYARLLGDDPRGKAMAKKLSRMRFSPSLFVLYFGLDTTYPDLAHHTICFGNRYKDLLSDIFDSPELAEDFSLYLHAPSVSDPDLAPPDCSTYYVLSPVPNLKTADIDWEEVGPRYADKILSYLEQHYMPGLRQHIVHAANVHPFDFRDELNAHQGSAFSLEPVLTQSAWFRTHNRDDHLDGLYFCGAGTHPGAGIPGVVGSAKATASVMLEDYGAQLA